MQYRAVRAAYGTLFASGQRNRMAVNRHGSALRPWISLAIAGLVIGGAGITTTRQVAGVSTDGRTGFTPRPEQCVDIYTATQGNPGCSALFDAADRPVAGGPVADPRSASWIAKENGSGAPALSSIECPADTEPGGAYYGRDPCQSMFYGTVGRASSDGPPTQITYRVTCDPSIGASCGHSWSSARFAVSKNARAQNPNTDHHFSALNQACDALGVSMPANKPPYVVRTGDRCERDQWLVQPHSPAVVPISAVDGATIVVGGAGQTDEDAVLGWYNASGSTASNLPEGMNANPADLVTAVRANSYLPYAILTALFCTANSYVFPSSYFDGYETANGCPPNGARFWSDITDAQVNARDWPVAEKALMRTLHHYGGIVFDTTGGNGPGFSLQLIGSSGFVVDARTDNDSNDPIRWLYDSANGGAGAQPINDGAGGRESGLAIGFENLAPYSVASNFHFCVITATMNHAYSSVDALPKTCGNM